MILKAKIINKDILEAKIITGNNNNAAADVYKGEYTVTPGPNEQILKTKDLVLRKDVMVKAIPDGYVIPEGTLEVTENGEHDVAKYDSVSVAVPTSDPYEVLNSIMDGSITEFYTLKDLTAHDGQSIGNFFNGCGQLKKWAMPNNTKALGYAFRYCNNLIYIDIGKPATCLPTTFYGKPLRGVTLIVRAETPPNVSGTFSGTSADSTTKIFVPKAALEDYKNASNWSLLGDYFKAIEDYPEEVNYDNY